ncbi:MAG: ABC transporter permease subunit [Phycisphaerales bacterium]|nr:ABC transporter permease subunit [Phycisphaerales bacterium]
MFFSSNDLHAIRLSLQVSAVATVVFLIPGVFLGTWLARTRSSWRVVVQGLVTVPLVLPPVVTGLCLLYVLVEIDSPIRFTWWAAVLASGTVAIPLLVRNVRAGVEAMDPRLPIVAATLGASRFRSFFTITLPVCWKGIVGGIVLFWARAMGEFGAVMVVATNTPGSTQTIPLAIYSKLESPKSPTIWPLVVVSLLISVLAIIFSEWLIQKRRRLGRTVS